MNLRRSCVENGFVSSKYLKVTVIVAYNSDWYLKFLLEKAIRLFTCTNNVHAFGCERLRCGICIPNKKQSRYFKVTIDDAADLSGYHNLTRILSLIWRMKLDFFT